MSHADRNLLGTPQARPHSGFDGFEGDTCLATRVAHGGVGRVLQRPLPDPLVQDALIASMLTAASLLALLLYTMRKKAG